MFRALRPSQIATILFYLAIHSGSASAAFNRQMDYILNLESNSEEDDQYFSEIEFNLNDDFKVSRFEGQYELTSNYFEDHDRSGSNDQHEGNFRSRYHFIRPTLWWNLDASLDLLPIETGVEIEDFSSQTLAKVSTGPALTIWKGLRGSIGFEIEVAVIDYSEATLDSKESGATLVYNYPFSDRTAAGLEIAYRESEYDDSINSDNDYELRLAGMFFSSRTRLVEYSLRGAVNDIDGDNDPDDENTYQIDVSYTPNSFSIMSIRFADTLQSAEVLNLSPGNLEESKFESGIFRNERTEVSYEYLYRNLEVGIRAYSNKLEDVVSSIGRDNDFDGRGVWVENQINEQWRIEVSFDRTITTSDNLEKDDLEVSVIYHWQHTKNISSSFELFVEDESDEGTDNEDDNISFQYRLTTNLFR